VGGGHTAGGVDPTRRWVAQSSRQWPMAGGRGRRHTVARDKGGRGADGWALAIVEGGYS
jgi:hypothetical protein